MLIDAHAHLDRYGADLPRVLAEISERQIFTVATAMDVPSYLRLLRIAEQCDLVLPIFGVHPKQAPEYAGGLSTLLPYIDESPALGEIGLDFHWVRDPSTYPEQRRVLEYFLAAAREQNKLVNLHTKGAERLILDLLERYDIRRAIVHWYSGPRDLLKRLAEFGAYFTVGVEVLFSDSIKTIAREIPDHLLLTETDNPGGLKWLKGVPGTPGVLADVVRALAELQAKTVAETECLVRDNFSRLIETDPWLADRRVLLSR
ncbi:MAG TPA: TatD family hydrolase [Candidatus Eisenbacteria bacterium]|nr:TatD family hydrolase [Candidatus Eisenbacteria bacterium]